MAHDLGHPCLEPTSGTGRVAFKGLCNGIAVKLPSESERSQEGYLAPWGYSLSLRLA